MNDTTTNIDKSTIAYTRGWRARRDGAERDAMCGFSEFTGWDDADAAIKSGRDISWSRGTDGLKAELPEVLP